MNSNLYGDNTDEIVKIIQEFERITEYDDEINQQYIGFLIKSDPDFDEDTTTAFKVAYFVSATADYERACDKIYATAAGRAQDATPELLSISVRLATNAIIAYVAKHKIAEASTSVDFNLPFNKSEIRGPFTQKHFETLTNPWHELFTLRELDNYLTIAGQADRLDLYFRGIK